MGLSFTNIHLSLHKSMVLRNTWPFYQTKISTLNEKHLHTNQNESDTSEILVPFAQNMAQSTQIQDLGNVS